MDIEQGEFMSKKQKGKEKNWNDHLENLASSRDRSKVFDDFLTITVCALSMQQKEDIYLQTIKRYKKEEVETFAMAFAGLVDWMEHHPLQDAFGDYFQQYISGGHNGQDLSHGHPLVGDLARMGNNPLPDNSGAVHT